MCNGKIIRIVVIFALLVAVLSILFEDKLHSKYEKSLMDVVYLLFRFILFIVCIMVSLFTDNNDNKSDCHKSGNFDTEHVTPGGPSSIEDAKSSKPKKRSVFNVVLVNDSLNLASKYFIKSITMIFWPQNRILFWFHYLFLVTYIGITSAHYYFRFSNVAASNELSHYWTIMKTLRILFSLFSIIAGIGIGRIFFQLKSTLHLQQDNLYQNLNQLNEKQKQKHKASYQFVRHLIIFGFIFCCLYDTVMLSSNKPNTKSDARLIVMKNEFYQFLAGSWTKSIEFFINCPEITIMIVVTLFIGKYMPHFGLSTMVSPLTRLIRGLAIYLIVICGHRSCVTFLTLQVIENIQLLINNLTNYCNEFFPEPSHFANNNNNNNNNDDMSDSSLSSQSMRVQQQQQPPSRASIYRQMGIGDGSASVSNNAALEDNKHNLNEMDIDNSVYRLEAFRGLEKHIDESKTVLTAMIYYLIIDRICYLFFDFWMYRCDDTIKSNFRNDVSFIRHAYHVLLILKIMYDMATFNRIWPHRLIKRLRYIRLYQWTKTKNENKEMELKLWDNYLNEQSFTAKSRFRLLGFGVDYKWFTLSFLFQMILSKQVYLNIFPSYLERIDDAIC